MKTISILKKNKKAEDYTITEFVKIFFAVLGIVLLVFLGAKLYGLFNYRSDLETAKATLDGILAQVDGLEENGKVDYLITGPRNWRLISYPNEKELCICPKGGKYRTIEFCKTEGVCFKKDYIVDITGYSSFCSGGEYVGACMEFPQGAFEVNLKKSKEYLYIEYINSKHSFKQVIEGPIAGSEIKSYVETDSLYIENKEKVYIIDFYPYIFSNNGASGESLIRLKKETDSIGIFSQFRLNNFFEASGELDYISKVGEVDKNGNIWFSKDWLATNSGVGAPKDWAYSDKLIFNEKETKEIVAKKNSQEVGDDFPILETEVKRTLHKTNIKLNYNDLLNNLNKLE